MNKKIIIVLSALTGLVIMNACNNSAMTAEQKDTATATPKDTSAAKPKGEDFMMQSVSAMMDRMSAIQLTDDVDNDFAALMIEHHRGAVDISEVEVAKGSDSAMTSMAKRMVSDHKSEIEQLKTFSRNHAAMHESKTGAKEHTHEVGEDNELSDAMTAERTKMKDLKTTGNPDKDYAQLMQAHHEAAVNMSKAEVAHGHHAELKKMAQKMMADDGREIKTFKDYLSANR